MTSTKPEIFTFRPIYGIALAMSAGKYDFPLIPIIEKYQMSPGIGKEVRAKLLSVDEFSNFFSFNSFEPPEDSAAAGKRTMAAVSEIRYTDWRPAKASELFGFGAAYPEEQKNSPILAMGTILSNSKGKPSIFWLGAAFKTNRRHLGITTLELAPDEEWAGRFLVVHK